MKKVTNEKACKAMAKARKADSKSVSTDTMKAVLEDLGLGSLTLTCLRCGETEHFPNTATILNLDFFWDDAGVFKIDGTMPCKKAKCEGLMYGWQASVEAVD